MPVNQRVWGVTMPPITPPLSQYKHRTCGVVRCNGTLGDSRGCHHLRRLEKVIFILKKRLTQRLIAIFSRLFVSPQDDPEFGADAGRLFPLIYCYFGQNQLQDIQPMY